jgi:GT2 family glycosyltransferase
VQCLLGLDSEEQGALLRTGVNVLNYTGDSVRESQWLSGCAMSYRRSAIVGMEFDESRRGGSFGEDVDFSARCRARGAVVWTPHARMEHRQSIQERLPDSQVTRRWIRNRGKLAYDRVGRVRLTWVVLGALSEAALVTTWALRDRDHRLAQRALAVLLGLWDVAVRKPV